MAFYFCIRIILRYKISQSSLLKVRFILGYFTFAIIFSIRKTFILNTLPLKSLKKKYVAVIFLNPYYCKGLWGNFVFNLNVNKHGKIKNEYVRP